MLAVGYTKLKTCTAYTNHSRSAVRTYKICSNECGHFSRVILVELSSCDFLLFHFLMLLSFWILLPVFRVPKNLSVRILTWIRFRFPVERVEEQVTPSSHNTSRHTFKDRFVNLLSTKGIARCNFRYNNQREICSLLLWCSCSDGSVWSRKQTSGYLSSQTDNPFLHRYFLASTAKASYGHVAAWFKGRTRMCRQQSPVLTGASELRLCPGNFYVLVFPCIQWDLL